MPQIALIATEPIAEHGLRVRRGETFETSPILAEVLTRARKAKFASAVEGALVRTAQSVRRGRYRRRDMTAEPVAE